jgi:hypothetical protein
MSQILGICDLFHQKIENKNVFRIAHRDFHHVTPNIRSIFLALGDFHAAVIAVRHVRIYVCILGKSSQYLVCYFGKSGLYLVCNTDFLCH